MKKPLYDPKKKAIPCKFGGYRLLCDMTPAQLAEEGYDEKGERLPRTPVGRKLKELRDKAIDNGMQTKPRDEIIRERLPKESKQRVANRLLEYYQIEFYQKNKPRQRHNCESCLYGYGEKHRCPGNVRESGLWFDTNKWWKKTLESSRAGYDEGADNCPGWREKV